MSVQEIEDDVEDGDLDEEDLSAMDEDLLAAAADLLPALAASMGPAAYAPVFAASHAEPLLGRLKPQQPLGLRAIAAGATAEVAEVLGVHMGGVVAQALPLLLRELQADVSGTGCWVLRHVALFVSSRVQWVQQIQPYLGALAELASSTAAYPSLLCTDATH
jgi:hypothetical protein